MSGTAGWASWAGVILGLVSFAWHVWNTVRKPKLAIRISRLNDTFRIEDAVDVYVHNRQMPTTQLLDVQVEYLRKGWWWGRWESERIESAHWLEFMQDKTCFRPMQQINYGTSERGALQLSFFGDDDDRQIVRLSVAHTMSDKRSHSRKVTVGELRAMARFGP